MPNRLENEWVIITGASAGIGMATAHLFAESKCNLILISRREKRLKNLKQKLVSTYDIEVEYETLDVRDRAACQTFCEALEVPIDVLINNAGLAKGKDAVYDADFDDWDTMIDTNVKGLLNFTRFISPLMKKEGSGHIINTGSLAGHEAYAGGSVYCATKHAVKAITEATKKDLHGTSIRVSMVSPGLVDTEFSEVRFNGDIEQADETYKGYKPLMAADIAEIIYFMANRPSHVNVLDTLVVPTAQSSSTMVARHEN